MFYKRLRKWDARTGLTDAKKIFFLNYFGYSASVRFWNCGEICPEFMMSSLEAIELIASIIAIGEFAHKFLAGALYKKSF
jgi:hypothetical protein